MWELDCEDGWAPKNWCFWTVMLQKTLESPLDCKEIQPVHLKEISPGISLEGMMLKLKLRYWPPHEKSWLIGKDFDPGRNWGPEEKGTREDEMAGWHHGLDGRECEWTPGDDDGQGGLACSDSWGRKGSDLTERWTELKKSLCKLTYGKAPELEWNSIMKRSSSSDLTLFLFLSCSKWSPTEFLFSFHFFSGLLSVDLLPIDLLCLLILYVAQIFNLKICLFNVFNLKSKYLLGIACILGTDDFILLWPQLCLIFSVSFFLLWVL